MSFRIRPVYKTHNQPRPLTEEELGVQVPNAEETEKIKQALLNFSRKSSHKSLMTSTELREAIRNSSINPDIFPAYRQNVADVLKQRDEYNSGNFPSASSSGNEQVVDPPIQPGFSSRAMQPTNTRNHGLDQELLNEINKLTVNPKDEEEPATTDPEKLERIKLKKQLINGYPARASLLRGSYLRTVGKGAGIRLTATGSVDAY